MRKVRDTKDDTYLGYDEAKKRYEHICECLIKEKRYEVLIFVKIWMEALVTQADLLKMTFKQVDILNLKVYDIKDRFTRKPISYVNISTELGELIKEHLAGTAEDKLFMKPLHWYRRAIQKASGENADLNQVILIMGCKLRINKMEALLFKYGDELKHLKFRVHTFGFGWMIIRNDYQNYSDPIKFVNVPEEMEDYIVSQIAAEKLNEQA